MNILRKTRLLFVSAILLSTASAMAGGGGLAGFWAQIDADDPGKSEGMGAKFLMPLKDGSSISFKASQFDEFDNVDYDLEITPLEIGIHIPLSQDNTTLYMAAGLSWYLIDAKDSEGVDVDAEDAWGWSVSMGAQIALTDALQLFGEVLYRGAEANADFDNLDDLVDGDSDDADIKLDGIGYEVGLMLRW